MGRAAMSEQPATGTKLTLLYCQASEHDGVGGETITVKMRVIYSSFDPREVEQFKRQEIARLNLSKSPWGNYGGVERWTAPGNQNWYDFKIETLTLGQVQAGYVRDRALDLLERPQTRQNFRRVMLEKARMTIYNSLQPDERDALGTTELDKLAEKMLAEVFGKGR